MDNKKSDDEQLKDGLMATTDESAEDDDFQVPDNLKREFADAPDGRSEIIGPELNRGLGKSLTVKLLGD